MKIFVFIFFIITFSFSKDTITWIKWNFPPNTILEGENKGQGWNEKKLKTLQEYLPMYNHTSVVMNANRGLALYKKKDALYCTNDIPSHPNLDLDDYMSMAAIPISGHYLVANKNKAHLFGKDGETVVLKDIIKKPNLKLVVSKGRPYLGASKVLNDYVSKNPNQKHINFLTTSNIAQSMFSQVAKGRADYTFEYIDKITYYGNKLGLLDQVKIFKIKENEGWFYGFSSCVKTPKGKQVIENINKALRILLPTNEWMMPYTQWFPSQKLKDDYIKYYKDVFLKAGEIYDENPRSR